MKQKPTHAHLPTAAVRRRVIAPLFLLATAGLTFLSGLQAQTAATTTASLENKEETVTLSPFVVTSDGSGYAATDSLMGGRVTTPLKFTPASISVITRQFLDDIAATDAADVVEWAVNISPAYVQNTSSFSTYTYNIRNLGASSSTRNYVLWYGQSDDFNTERYEFARGPNGTVYGDSNIGGVPTTWTKRANFSRNRTTLKTTADSYGTMRAAIDVNHVLNERLALRFNAVTSENANWRNVPDKTFDGAALSATFKVTQRDELRFDGELAEYTYPFYASNYIDQASFWNGTTSYNGVTNPSTSGTGVQVVPASFVYIPGAPNGGLNQMGGFFRTTGTNLALYPTARSDIANFPALPSREFSLNPSDALSRLDQYFYNISWTHRFADNLWAEIAYARHDASRLNGPTAAGDRYNEYRIDVNTVLPGGAPNPNFGKAYQDKQVARHTPRNNVSQVHALLNYRFTTSWVKQNFIALAGSRLDRFNNTTHRLVRTNPPTSLPSAFIGNNIANNYNPASANNIVLVRRYWDQAGEPVGFDPIPSIPGVNLEYVLSGDQYQRKAVDFGQIASVSRFFDDRLALMLGYREDHVIDVQHATANIPADPVTGLPRLGARVLTAASPTIPQAVVGAKIRTNLKAPSKNAGLVYWVRPWVGLVANYAESIAANTAGAPLLDGSQPGITRNKGEDLGLKFDLFEGRMSATVSYYKNKQIGNLLGTAANSVQINRLWENVNLTTNTVADIDHRDTQDKEGKGWEIEAVGNVTKNLRLTANLALPQSILLNFRPGLRAYLEQNLPTWQAAADAPDHAAVRTQMLDDIQAIRNTLNAATIGTPVNDTYKYLANLYATYSFRNGRLKNFDVGGGGHFRGKNKVSNFLVGDATQSLYSPAYHTLDAHISYRHKFSKKLTGRFQINVKNLLDEDSLALMPQDGNAYGTYRVGGLAANPLTQATNNIRQHDPRKFIFTATFEF